MAQDPEQAIIFHSDPLVVEAKLSIKRVHEGLLHYYERLLLWWFAGYMPAWVTPDKLTLLGLLASIVIGFSYICTKVNPLFWHLANIGLIVHWFADSMDGTLARYRDRCRPNYGQFVDVFVDNISMLFWFIPLGYTSAIGDPRVGYALVLAFYMIVIKVAYQDLYEKKHVISMGMASGTEGRIGLIVLGLLYYFFPTTWVQKILWVAVALITTVMFVYAVIEGSMLAWRLRCQDERALAERDKMLAH